MFGNGTQAKQCYFPGSLLTDVALLLLCLVQMSPIAFAFAL